jgi:phosphopantothenoylcysteine decarboxylase / phosphopantothenate---cysteine ligase
MTGLTHRHIILGVTGGIAAYKSADLIRRLRDAGAEVRVVMTEAACEFITPLTLQALSGNPVRRDLFDPAAEAAMGHIELARWADAVVIAPASADFLARLAAGSAGDLLSTLCLASDSPLLVAPAMNQAMWRDAATRANCDRLQERGVHVAGPGVGSQACGDTGPGRMLEPEQLLLAVSALFETRLLEGRNVIITAGPTREAIDPVRYISNHSSGKMGFALASAAADAGARVSLIAGPVGIDTPPRVERIDVVSALDMHAAVMERIENCDLFIGCAAVADFRPASIAPLKIKKGAAHMDVHMVPNPDILADVANRRSRPFTVGFAAETDHVAENARAKLLTKNIDLIIANDVARDDIAFGSDYNEVTVVSRSQDSVIPRGTKIKVARALISLIARQLPPAAGSAGERGKP